MAIGGGSNSLTTIRNEYLTPITLTLSVVSFIETINGQNYFNCITFPSSFPQQAWLYPQIIPQGWWGTALSGQSIYNNSNFNFYTIDTITPNSGTYGITSYTIRLYGTTTPATGSYTIALNNSSLNRYYAGFTLPIGIGSIPQSGAISFNNFRNTARYTQTYHGYLNPAFNRQPPDAELEKDFAYDISENFIGGDIPNDNNWYTRLSNSYLDIYTGPVQSGYYITIPSTQADFLSYRRTISDGYSTWYRWTLVKDYGYALSLRSTQSTVVNQTYQLYRGSGTVQSQSWTPLYAPPTTISSLYANAHYRLRWVLDFRCENFNGFGVNNSAFYGVMVTWPTVYSNNL